MSINSQFQVVLILITFILNLCLLTVRYTATCASFKCNSISITINTCINISFNKTMAAIEDEFSSQLIQTDWKKCVKRFSRRTFDGKKNSRNFLKFIFLSSHFIEFFFFICGEKKITIQTHFRFYFSTKKLLSTKVFVLSLSFSLSLSLSSFNLLIAWNWTSNHCEKKFWLFDQFSWIEATISRGPI